MKQKIKSYAFWTSLSAAVVVFVNSLGKIFGFTVEESLITNLIMAVCGILIVLGVVNMPFEENKESEDCSPQSDKKTDDDENLKN